MSNDERELDRLRAERDRFATRYERLRNRRSVKAALWLAGLPVRVRGRFAGTQPSTARLQPPSTTPSPDGADAAPRDRLPDLDLLETAPPVSVVIPVYNAPAALEDCLRSVVSHTSSADQIIVIDDASTDPMVASVLGSYEGIHGIRVLHNHQNLGFTATVNRGMRECQGDVILLNSDTRVPPRWAERLRLAAYSDGRVGSVTAVSDNAGAFSVPELSGNTLPAGWDVADASRAVARGITRRWVTTPTANGFCCYLKRAAIDDVGVFDATSFSRGYGEENDWSLRASAAGWSHLVALDVYVQHVRSASFGPEREALAAEGARTLAEKHPGYQRRFDEFVGSEAMRAARVEIRDALVSPKPRRRVLTVVHDLGGGTEHSSRDLGRAITDHVEMLVLRCSPHRLELSNADGGILERVPIDPPVALRDVVHPSWREAVTDLLVRDDVELIHLRQFMNQPPDLMEVARALGLPLVVSLHDFYLVCPTAHLIDESSRYCGGVCTSGQGECPAVPWVAAGPHLKHAWVGEWQRRTAHLMGLSDAVVAASQSTIDVHREVLPGMDAVVTQVIAHGRDVAHVESLAAQPVSGEPLRVLLAGTIGRHKGNEVVRQILANVPPGAIEFHVLGTFPGPPIDGVVVHGRYQRADYPQLVAQIRPSLAAILSITPETWSHTLTEAWGVGLPVLVTDLGASAERVRAQGGGWVVPAGDAAAAFAELARITGDPEEFSQRAAEAGRTSWDSTASMAAKYLELYRTVLQARSTVG